MAAALIGAIRELERRNRLACMIGSLVLIWGLWVLPLRIYPSLQSENQVFLALSALSGMLLGIGRQGIDWLAVRVSIASMALVVAIPPICGGFGECARVYEISAPVYGAFGLIAFELIAIPINALWNRGFNGLAPEFAWSQLSRLKAWQWVILAMTAVTALGVYYFSLDIPAY
jgi:hypothetical protein